MSQDVPITTDKAYREQMTAMVISLSVAVILLGVKVWAAYITHSSSLYSDAAESVVHTVAVAIAVMALHLSHKPADGEHHFGHDKAAYLSSGFEGAMIVSAALFILYQAGYQFTHGVEVSHLSEGIILSSVALVVNLILGLSLLRIGKKRKSVVLSSNGHHVLSDVWTSVAVLVALVLIKFTGWKWWDPWIALFAACNITYTGGKLIKQSLAGLMDAAEPETEKQIRSILAPLCVEHHVSYHHLRHRHSGNTHWVELHLAFEDEISVKQAHDVATILEGEIARSLLPFCRVITHIEPASIGDHDEAWEGGKNKSLA